MAQRRPIASHPAFAPLLALWFAALLGLGVAVLPEAVLARALASSGLGALLPLTWAGRVGASVLAALVGAAAGMILARLLARRSLRDPRPVYSEPELAPDEPVRVEPARRPLRVREELDEGFSEPAVPLSEQEEADLRQEPEAPQIAVESQEGFMILTPQPAHPSRPLADLDALLAQFDDALAAFRNDEEPQTPAKPAGPDPVHAFVARQTGGPAPSPLGGTMPDHQAELRAALDKLARAHRSD